MTWKNTQSTFWCGFGAGVWSMVHVAPPPLGPTSGPPLVHLVAPPWSIRWLPLPLIPLWIGRSSVGVQAERSEPQPTKRTTSNLTPIAVGSAHGMCMQWLNTPSWGSAPPTPRTPRIKVILPFIVNDRSWGFGTSSPEPPTFENRSFSMK